MKFKFLLLGVFTLLISPKFVRATCINLETELQKLGNIRSILQCLNEQNELLRKKIDNILSSTQGASTSAERGKHSDVGQTSTSSPRGDALLQGSLGTGLIAYYPFELDGMDETQNYNHANISEGRVSFPKGKVGHAASFEDSLVQVVDPKKFLVNLDGFSMSAWVSIPNTGENQDKQHYFFEIGTSRSNEYIQLYRRPILAGGKIVFEVSSSVGSAAAESRRSYVNENGWIHLVALIDPNKKSIHLYINGVLQQRGAFESFSVKTLRKSTDKYIYFGKTLSGQKPTVDYCTCLIDDVRIYNRKLSPSEVLLLYRSSK